MKVRISGLKLAVGESEEQLARLAADKVGLPVSAVSDVRIRRRSLDARKRNRLAHVYTVVAEVDAPSQGLLGLPGVELVAEQAPEPLMHGAHPLLNRPVVIGAGPAGLFAAWRLASEGYAPILLERGKAVEERRRDTATFWKRGELDPESNVLFGEGGAGAFSDGKLTARTKDPRHEEVLDVLVSCGAPESVRYDSRAHVGTDALPRILQAMRRELTARGAEIRFSSCVRDFVTDQGRLSGITTDDGLLPAGVAILAIGHSARDTYAALLGCGVRMEQKPFAVGIRVQHRQEIVNLAQYGTEEPPANLEAAEYVLKCAVTRVGRAVYSFCMCPGGAVIPCASAPGELFCNGMSGKSRGGPFANGAIVAQVPIEDFPDSSPLAGVEYQRRLEQAAFASTGGTYALPVMSLDDLVAGRKPAGGVRPAALRSFPRAETVDLGRRLLPERVVAAVREASHGFARSIRGWHGSGAAAFGVETRTSAPVRIVRGEDGQSVTLRGLFPAGEGAGYAGGIVSAAVDGLRAAEALIARYAPPR